MAANTGNWYALPIADRKTAEEWWQWAAWNFFERVASAAALIALLPLGIVLAIIVAIVSRRSPLVAHLRTGWRGQNLWMLKFRTIWDTPIPQGRRRPLLIERIADTWIPEKNGGHPRVTHPLAEEMRRYSVDELPQLWHVLCGEMALVGPRPLTAEELRVHYGDAAFETLSVRPGITGLWQAVGRSRLTYRQRLRCDLFLVRKVSPRLCAALLWKTLPAVIRGENAF